MEITIYKCSREVCPRRDLMDIYKYFDINERIAYKVNPCTGLCEVVIDDDEWNRDVESVYKYIIANYDLFEYEKGYLLAKLTKFKQYLEED